MKTLTITPSLQRQIDRVLRAAALYPNEDDGAGPLEQEQLALAAEFLHEVARQQARHDRLPRTAKPAVTPVIEVELRPKRRPA